MQKNIIDKSAMYSPGWKFNMARVSSFPFLLIHKRKKTFHEIVQLEMQNFASENNTIYFNKLCFPFLFILVPLEPLSPRIRNVTSRWIELTWQPPSNADSLGNDLLGYRVYVEELCDHLTTIGKHQWFHKLKSRSKEELEIWGQKAIKIRQKSKKKKRTI